VEERFLEIGRFSVEDAKAVLAAFEKRGIDFRCQVDEREFKNRALLDACFGTGILQTRMVAIAVPAERLQVAYAMLPGLLKIKV
jgi:hypothetical protein